MFQVYTAAAPGMDLARFPVEITLKIVISFFNCPHIPSAGSTPGEDLCT